ncbi:phosphonatase-like hydrolase [Aquimarina sp. MAR_2010_214]|uniref:phosphonatase-like hydrolase n=1 Tax=Aquimarina sp. MAR_2010_214 TaxID=1250026 RepID=UPI000C710C64|nr:phosphonatase-like hydrolase [Aquimarina sp. MAR_2010_214]PKV52882.1 phosphonatase-like hydrolase [Aquimarina sp. MAR_2010_214]
MNKKIELAVFDMAGTTVNEDNIVYKTVQQVVNDEGYNVSLNEVLEYGAGKEKHQAIVDILTSVTSCEEVKSTAKRAFSNFRPILKKLYQEVEVVAFDRVEELFDVLKNNEIKIVLNTGYDSKTANQLIKKIGWKKEKHFDALLTSDDVTNGRPHKEMICKAMQMFDITDTSKVLKAGDSAIDIEEGKNADCGITVGVLTGAQNREQLEKAKPDYIVNELIELINIIFY